MEQSESIEQLTGALVKARPAFKPLTPDKTNPHFKNRYASLDQCISVTVDALGKNGLVVTQWLEPGPDGHMGMTTQVQHVSGEFMRSTSYLPISQPGNPQAAGSAITYARRYAYCAALGLAPDEDDDAEGAKPVRPQTSEPPSDFLEKKRKAYFAKARDAGYTPEQAKELVKVNYECASFNDATFEQIAHACDFMDKKIAAKGGHDVQR